MNQKLTYSQLATLRDMLKYEKLDSTQCNLQRSREIHYALNRIEKGEYGDCRICKQHINYKHLLKVPMETKCFNCAGKKVR